MRSESVQESSRGMLFLWLLFACLSLASCQDCDTPGYINPQKNHTSVPEPTGGVRCTTSGFVQVFYWRCENLTCCDEPCNCDRPDLIKPYQSCPTITAERVTLTCYVQHQLLRRYRYICCPGTEENADKQCVDTSAQDETTTVLTLTTESTMKPSTAATSVGVIATSISLQSTAGPPTSAETSTTTTTTIATSSHQYTTIAATASQPQTTMNGKEPHSAAITQAPGMTGVIVAVLIILFLVILALIIFVCVRYCRRHKAAENEENTTVAYDNNAYDLIASGYSPPDTEAIIRPEDYIEPAGKKPPIDDYEVIPGGDLPPKYAYEDPLGGCVAGAKELGPKPAMDQSFNAQPLPEKVDLNALPSPVNTYANELPVIGAIYQNSRPTPQGHVNVAMEQNEENEGKEGIYAEIDA